MGDQAVNIATITRATAGLPRSERIVGPPADKAFDAEGRPTKAAIGFAQKLGVWIPLDGPVYTHDGNVGH